MRSIALTAALVLAGGIAGSAFSFAVGEHSSSKSRLEKKAEAAQQAPPPTYVPNTTSAVLTQQWQLAGLDDRLKRLELEREKKTPADSPEEASADVPPMSPEEARAFHERTFNEQLSAHSRQQVDSGWAPAMRTQLSRELEPLQSTSGFRLGDIDCRSTTCVAQVEWPTYADAMAHYSTLLQSAFKEPCSKTIVLPEPADPGVPYSAKTLFECARE